MSHRSIFLYLSCFFFIFVFFFFKQKTAYEMRISDWSSDVCSSDLQRARLSLTDHQLCLVHELGLELLVAERPLAAADGALDVLLQRRAVLESDLDGDRRLVAAGVGDRRHPVAQREDRKSTRLNSSH